MTRAEKEKAEAVRRFIQNRAHGICEHQSCMESGTQICHMISKSKSNLKKYGKKIVHHPKLLRLGCAKHNDSFNIGFKPAVIAEKIQEIKEAGIENWREE